MKTYRVYRDILVKDEGDELLALTFLDNMIDAELRKKGTASNLFTVEENPFADDDRTSILEIARVAIEKDRDDIGETLDLSDEYLNNLLVKIKGIMQ